MGGGGRDRALVCPAQGGTEARHSNELLHRIIAEAVEAVAPEVGPGLVALVNTREEISSLLKLDDVIDLVRFPFHFTDTHHQTARSHQYRACKGLLAACTADVAAPPCLAHSETCLHAHLRGCLGPCQWHRGCQALRFSCSAC